MSAQIKRNITLLLTLIACLSSPPIALADKFINTFLIYYGSPNFSPGGEQLLSKFDLFSVDRMRYDDLPGGSWTAIKSLNPDAEIYLYEIASETSNFHDNYLQVYLNDLGRHNVSRGHSLGSLNGDNPDLFLLDADGNRAFNFAYSNPALNQYWYLMDFGSEKYQRYWLEAVTTDVIYQPWVADGIFADNCSVLNWGGYAVPVKYNTTSAWANAMNTFVSTISQGAHSQSQKLWCNRGQTQTIDGFNAWLALDQSSSPPDVVLEEGAFAVSWGTGDTQFYPEMNWKRQVDIMGQIHSSRIAFLSHTDLPLGGIGTDNHGSPVTFWQSFWYSYTSFLLGMDDRRRNAYFMFKGPDINADFNAKIWWFDEYDSIHLGLVRSTYNVSTNNGVNIYWREFENGYVFVNPTPNNAPSIPLPQPGRELSHDNFKNDPGTLPIVETISLNAHHGTIVLKASADLVITQATPIISETVGENLTYSFLVTNTGPASATAVTVQSSIPPGFSFVSATASQGGCIGSSAVNCALGDLSVSAAATVTIVVIPLNVGTFMNTAAVSSAEPDLNPTNNTATVTVTVNPSTKPLINAFWPASGVTYAGVLLFGKNFQVVSGLNPIVKFNNGTLSAPIVQVVTPELLFVMQPAGTTVGKITLETANGLATSPTDYNVIQPGLKINGLWPGEVKVGVFDFIFGGGFSLTSGANKVDVNGVPAPIVQVLDATLLAYMVPAGATSGPVHVTTGGITATSPIDLVVLP